MNILTARPKCRNSRPSPPWGRGENVETRGKGEAFPHGRRQSRFGILTFGDFDATLTASLRRHLRSASFEDAGHSPPAVAGGIQSPGNVFPKACGVDSRSRGNDRSLQGSYLANDTCTCRCTTIPRLDEARPSKVYTYRLAVGEGRTASFDRAS
jgi:hypothetical protein